MNMVLGWSIILKTGLTIPGAGRGKAESICRLASIMLSKQLLAAVGMLPVHKTKIFSEKYMCKNCRDGT